MLTASQEICSQRNRPIKGQMMPSDLTHVSHPRLLRFLHLKFNAEKKNIHYLENHKCNYFLLLFYPYATGWITNEEKNFCKPGIGEGQEGWTDFYCVCLIRQKKNIKPFQKKLWSRFRMPSQAFSLCLHQLLLW